MRDYEVLSVVEVRERIRSNRVLANFFRCKVYVLEKELETRGETQ